MIQKYGDLIIKDVVWVKQAKLPLNIGMVMVQNELTNEIKVYVGTGAGHDEDSDIIAIIYNGGKLHLSSAIHLFEHFGGEINPDTDWLTALKHFEKQVYPESVFPEPTQERTDALDQQHKTYLTAASGSMGRRTCGLIRDKVEEIRKLRTEANEDRGEPGQHPSKKEGGIDG